jgi:predicted GH43/DUF377 family glycosyl hydrolase
MLRNKTLSWWLWSLFIALAPDAFTTVRDLNTLSQDFVLETKQLAFEEFPTALNPAITRWRGKILMSFRIRDPITKATDRIGLVWLNDEMVPVGNPTVLNGMPRTFSSHPWPQDPRLHVIGDTLYFVYSDLVTSEQGEVRRMFVADVVFDGEEFSLNPPRCLLLGEEPFKRKQEKNWVPFDYAGMLLLGYSVIPHHVLLPQDGENRCQTLAVTGHQIVWPWGEVRGGTPALQVDGEYLAFFHSIKAMPTVQSGGNFITHYFMAAYTFEKDPPFRITRISKAPIVHPSFYDGPAYQTWKPLRVVFPSGYLIDGEHLWIAYGKQDHEIWLAKLDKKRLLKSLIPVNHE